MSTVAPASEDLAHGRRMGVLAICCLSLFIVGIDATGVNLALPSIRRDLGADGSQLQWVIDAYTLVLASLLMLAGSTGDRLGRRRVFQCGLVLFGVGSLLCSAAQTPGVLIAARTAQAAGGSMLNPVAMSIITNTFREPKERAQAIGIWGATVGLSMALGPVLGGVLVDSIGWRAIFWLNIPVVVAAIVLSSLFVPESRADRVRRLDPLAQALVVALLASLTFGIIEGRTFGWGSATVLGCFAGAGVALVVLVAHELRRTEPLLDPRFFASIPFSGAVASAILGFCAMGGFLFLNTLYLQDVRQLSPLQAGLMTLPMAGATALMSPISGRVVGVVGPRLPMLVAGGGIALSGTMLLRIEDGTSFAYLGLAYLAFGIGFGMLNAPITNAAVSGMPRAQAGVAAAIASTSRQVGMSLGVATLPTVTYAHLHGPASTGLAAASHTAWSLVAGCGVGVAVLALVTTSRAAIRTRDRVAAELGAA
ncbi:DHA2 family efflux MFS transporter permease subunit [Nocardioides jiangxiensis]|uniref:DHA2 family efflux MFS transporter permease subunit n=1 Tax=Nocardioides jiangxiensis TaxID=3064524 RepID=A0ABT9AXP7_9ACTN|nr:DHA2 family efflux MFS transporter permease subunit [Nocardioides sp. WY-20]MDO7867142.1 DHA2 family efflux MFS transporter permease subunit [Nocardioides sp. WY-20]